MALKHRVIGKVARLIWRVARPRTIGVRAVLVDENDRIALVRHTYTDQWYLPGGGVKRGESAEAAILRELEEEVAVTDPRIERVLGVYHSRQEAKDDHIVIFAVRTTSDGSNVLCRNDQAEIETARWFAPTELPRSTSPATARRIDEYLAGATGLGAW